jgi:hypothetical protein
MPLLAELCSIYPNADLFVEPRISLDHTQASPEVVLAVANS